MAGVHGKGTTISLDNSAGSPVDITTYCDSIPDFTTAADMSEVSVFTGDDKTYVAGQLGSKFSLSGPWDSVIDAHMYGIRGKAGTVSTVPGGGAVTYSGEAYCDSYSWSANKGDAITWSASFTVTGAVGRA